MKYEISDEIYLIYKGVKHRVVESKSFYRPFGGRNSDHIYILENGHRITSAHWKYGLVDLPAGVGPFTWHLRASMPDSIVREVMSKPSPLFENLAKIPEWSGGSFSITTQSACQLY